MLGSAIALAAQVHRDQQDKAGRPYILHPLRVMLNPLVVVGDALDFRQTCAVLHDVLEDVEPRRFAEVEVTIVGEYGEEVHDVVTLLTHQPGEDYATYIAKLSAVDACRTIKIADLEDNLIIHRLIRTPTDADLTRITKYHMALAYLRSIGTPAAERHLERLETHVRATD